MISLVFVAVVGQSLSGPPRDPMTYLSDYRPPVLALKDLRAVGLRAFVGRRAVRGYWAIESVWVIHHPLSVVAHSLAKEMAPPFQFDQLSDERIMNRGTIVFGRSLADRRVEARARSGREIQVSAGPNKGWHILSKSEYTTVLVIESPRLVGSMPAKWPAKAMNADSLPKSWKGLPLKELPALPTAWVRTSELSPVGGTQYWMKWVVHEDPSTLFPRLCSALEATGNWALPERRSFPFISCRPKRRGVGPLWIKLDFTRELDSEVPKAGWSIIHSTG